MDLIGPKRLHHKSHRVQWRLRRVKIDSGQQSANRVRLESGGHGHPWHAVLEARDLFHYLTPQRRALVAIQAEMRHLSTTPEVFSVGASVDVVFILTSDS